MSSSSLPSGSTLPVTPFTARISEAKLQQLQQLIELSPIGPPTYENLHADTKDFSSFGLSRDWLVNAKHRWSRSEGGYDWRATESRINRIPNFTAPIVDDGGFTYNVHFMALFSKNPQAVPYLWLHGWPGSFLEFLPALEILKEKYTPENLPFHVVVPSLPGYAYSSGPSTDRDSADGIQTIAYVMDKLMVGLGFGKSESGGGYIAQGGDLGSFIARVLAASSTTACQAVHFNLCLGNPTSPERMMEGVTQEEMAGLGRAKEVGDTGLAFAQTHATRPATIGLVLSASPIALLAWIGEKYVQWSDETPNLDDILDSVTLYWLTDTFPRSLYPIRQLHGNSSKGRFHDQEEFYINKPMGYSWHRMELAPMPKAWIANTGKLVWHRAHEKGGHFAAMEEPMQFVKDMEEFVAEAWPVAESS